MGKYKDSFILHLENKNKTLKYQSHNSLESFPCVLLIEVWIVAATSAVTGVCPTSIWRGPTPCYQTLPIAIDTKVCSVWSLQCPIVCICCKASTHHIIHLWKSNQTTLQTRKNVP